jgi:PAS domain S-box-containing protein
MFINSSNNLSVFDSSHVPQIHDHICFLYDSEVDWQAFAAVFIKTGLSQGEKCIYIFDVHTSHQVHEALRVEGIDVAECELAGRLTILHGRHLFPAEEEFNAANLGAYLKKETVRAQTEGYPALRVTIETGWVSKFKLSSPQLTQMEMNLDREFFPVNPCLMVCQYEKGLISSEIVDALLISHKGIVIKNKIYPSIYYRADNGHAAIVKTLMETHTSLSAIEREQLREQSQRARLYVLEVLLDESQSVIIGVDEHGLIVDTNQLAAKFLEGDSETLLNHSLHNFTSDGEVLSRNPNLNPFGVARIGEIEFTINGQLKTLKINVVPVTLEGRRLYYASGRDITEQKRTERALQESESRFRGLWSAMGQGVALNEIIFGPQGKPSDFIIVDVNPAFEKITGVDRTRVVGKRSLEVLGFIDQVILDLCSEVVKSGKPTSFDHKSHLTGECFNLAVFPISKSGFATVLNPQFEN